MRHFKVFVLGLPLALSVVVQTTTAQDLPTDARALYGTRVPFPITTEKPKNVPLVEQVGAIGMTVSDMDASIDFYSRVLSFEKLSDVEVTGEDYERLQGVFGLRMRVVRMRLGDEFIELTEYLAPKGRPVPVDSRSNDRWFQHIAIITSDMDKAYTLLRQNKVEHASTGPQRLPDWNKNGLHFPADDAGEQIKNKTFSETCERADGLVIVAPEYNHGYPGMLKHVLDSNLKEYIHKAVGVCGVSAGGFGGTRLIEALLPVLRELGLVTIFWDGNFSGAQKLFDADGKILDEATHVKRIDKFLAELIWMSKVLRYGRESVTI
jgi:NAD(P)H-dependent FMN reductase